MSPISNAWPSVSEFLGTLDTEYADRITSMFSFLCPRFIAIEAYASSLHQQNLPCRLITEHYTWGQSFIVFELVFSHKESWVIRCGLPPMGEYFNTAAQLERKILNEVAALSLIRTRTSIPVPTVISSHATTTPSSHPLGTDFPPFVLMTAMAGATIEDLGISTDPGGGDPLQGDEKKRPFLDRYLRDIADIHAQLSRITFDRIGSFTLAPDGVTITIGPGSDFGLGPFSSAREYFEIQAEAYERIASLDSEDISDTNSDDLAMARLKRQFTAALWRAAVMPLLDARDDWGPFPMRHGDLHSANVLVDPQTGGIVGVLDWDCAGTVPWEAFAVPTFEVSCDFVDPQERGFGDTGSSSGRREKGKNERLEVHRRFNAALRAAQISHAPLPLPPSGRTLADLHNSKAGHVAAYLAHWMFSTVCDYDYAGRALHKLIGLPDDMDVTFQKFVNAKSGGDVPPDGEVGLENPLCPALVSVSA